MSIISELLTIKQNRAGPYVVKDCELLNFTDCRPYGLELSNIT